MLKVCVKLAAFVGRAVRPVGKTTDLVRLLFKLLLKLNSNRHNSIFNFYLWFAGKFSNNTFLNSLFCNSCCQLLLRKEIDFIKEKAKSAQIYIKNNVYYVDLYFLR